MNLSNLWGRLRNSLTLPSGGDLQTWRVYLLNVILLILVVFGTLAYTASMQSAFQGNSVMLGVVVTIAYVILLAVALMPRLPYYFRVGILLLITYGLAISITSNLGLVSSGRIYLFTVSLMAVLFLGLKAGLIAWGFNLVILGLMIWQLNMGHLQFNPPQEVSAWVVTTITFAMMNALAVVSVGLLVKALASNLAELQTFTQSLEQRVAERTRVIEASVEVSRALSGILELTILVQEVVDQIRAAFDYYYVQIYLFNETQDKLILAAGSGEMGNAMLAAGHSLSPNQGIVGQAASGNKHVLVQDVALDDRWQPNALLPETKAETAVPIAIGSEVLGVLDVQANQVNSLSSDDLSFLQAVAGQVAVAIRNARLYEAAEQRLVYEARANTISQQIQQAASVETILQVAAQELEQALGVDRVTVQLGNEGNGRIP